MGTSTGVFKSRNGIYFFDQESPISGLKPDDEVPCFGASILPNKDKGCWPLKGKTIRQILATCQGKKCEMAGTLRNLSHGLYCWTEIHWIAAPDK
jgi:hypothetical protein